MCIIFSYHEGYFVLFVGVLCVCVCVCVMFMHGDGHVSFFVLYIYLVPAACILFVLCFYNLFSAWLVVSYRGLAEEKRPLSPSSGPYQAEDKIAQQTVICHSNPASLSSTESSEGGKTLFFVCPMEIINCAIWKVENFGTWYEKLTHHLSL